MSSAEGRRIRSLRFETPLRRDRSIQVPALLWNSLAYRLNRARHYGERCLLVLFFQQSGFLDDDGTTTFTYDSEGIPIGTAAPGGSCTGTISDCVEYDYNADGLLDEITWPTSTVVTTEISYTDDGNVETIAHKRGATTLWSHTYDGTDGTDDTPWIQTDTDNVSGDVTTYTYDELGQLTEAITKNSGLTIIDDREWTYDDNGNRLTAVINGTTTTYTYNAANQLCWEYSGTTTNDCSTPPAGAVTYTYDDNGNLTANSAGLSMSYNALEQTSAWTPVGGSSTSFVYGGSDGADRTEIGAGDVLRSPLGPVGRDDGATVYRWIRDSDGFLLGQDDGSDTHWHLTDIRGSVVALIDDSGNIANTYSYTPFGAISSSTGSVVNPWQFASGYADGADLIRFGERHYIPSLGMWAQIDPVVGEHPYRYVDNNPVNRVDPDGRAWVKVWKWIKKSVRAVRVIWRKVGGFWWPRRVYSWIEKIVRVSSWILSQPAAKPNYCYAPPHSSHTSGSDSAIRQGFPPGRGC